MPTRRRLVWVSNQPDGRYENPLAKQGTLQLLPRLRLGGPGRPRPIWPASPYDLSHSGAAGPAVLDQKPPPGNPAGRYENLEGGTQLYPHIYGPLNLDAVVRATPFRPAKQRDVPVMSRVVLPFRFALK